MKIQNLHDGRVTVRLPSALLDDLKADALENMRSLNDHIVWILRDYMRSEREIDIEQRMFDNRPMSIARSEGNVPFG